MTYTVQDVLNRAVRRLRIIPGGETLDAEDQADALAAYNSMMFGFEAAGLALTDSAAVAYAHAIQTAADNFPLADKHFDSVWSVLMEKLIGQFPVDASVAQGVGNDIRAGWDRLYAAFLSMDEADVSGAGPLPSRTDRWFTI